MKLGCSQYSIEKLFMELQKNKSDKWILIYKYALLLHVFLNQNYPLG